LRQSCRTGSFPFLVTSPIIKSRRPVIGSIFLCVLPDGLREERPFFSFFSFFLRLQGDKRWTGWVFFFFFLSIFGPIRGTVRYLRRISPLSLLLSSAWQKASDSEDFTFPSSLFRKAGERMLGSFFFFLLLFRFPLGWCWEGGMRRLCFLSSLPLTVTVFGYYMRTPLSLFLSSPSPPHPGYARRGSPPCRGCVSFSLFLGRKMIM